MVKRAAIVDRMLFVLAKIDSGMADKIATGLGKKVPSSLNGRLNLSVGADAGRETETRPAKKSNFVSPALSMANTVKNTIKTRKVAILAGDGVEEESVEAMKKALTKEGAIAAIIAPHGGTIKGSKGAEIAVDYSLLNAASVLFDAVYIPGGQSSIEALQANGKTIHFINEMYRHCKAIAATGEGAALLAASAIRNSLQSAESDPALIVDEQRDGRRMSAKFIEAIAQHRNWDREKLAQAHVPA
jgi:catalase